MSMSSVQRWRDGRHSFIPTSAGGFDPSRYDVTCLDDATARAYVHAHHYSGTYPAARFRYGLVLRGAHPDDALVGVAVFSVPASTRVITKAFPDLDCTSAVELGRLVLEGPPANTVDGRALRAPANSESWFVARCTEDLHARGISGVIAFSDPVPRCTAAGELVLPGHVGVVYQALNMTYTGRGTARAITVLPDGRSVSDRALQKVRTGEQGHEYVERRLVGFGARVPRPGEDMAGWLRDALVQAGAVKVRHAGNHRFVLALGGRRERAQLRIALPALTYPKSVDVLPRAA